jgi:hypothetical protein
MHLTVLLTGSRVPIDVANALLPHLDVPTLARRLARGRKGERLVATSGDAADAWLAKRLWGTPEPPTAPYAWADLTGERISDGTIWHADPIRIDVGRDSLMVELLDEPPSDAEADALLETANACLGDAAGLVHRGPHWFLRSREPWRISGVPVSAAAGQSLLPLRNDDDLRWSRLHNSIQMSWHTHAINEARTARSQRSVGGVWLHGGGSWSARDALPWPAVYSDRPELRGITVAAGWEARAAAAPVNADALLVWDDADAARRRQDWPRWLDAMQSLDRRLAALPMAALTVVLTGATTAEEWQLRDSDRLCFWRDHSLDEALSEGPA